MFDSRGSPQSTSEVQRYRCTVAVSDTILVQDSFMLIPDASHSGASAARVLRIEDLKRALPLLDAYRDDSFYSDLPVFDNAWRSPAGCTGDLP
jgi:hypothetical protein